MVSSFYRGAQGIFVVYDVSRAESFDNVKMWLEEIACHSSDQAVTKILVGNKCDLPKEVREVALEKAKQFADQLHIPHIETSAKTSENVSKAFETLARTLCEKRASKLGQHNSDTDKTVGLQSTNNNSSTYCYC